MTPPSVNRLRDLEAEWQRMEDKASGRRSTPVKQNLASNSKGFSSPYLNARRNSPKDIASPSRVDSSLSAALSLPLISTPIRKLYEDTSPSADKISAISVDPISPALTLAASTSGRHSDELPISSYSDQEEPVLKEASEAFLQQVQNLHNRYSGQVEQLKSQIMGLVHERDTVQKSVVEAFSNVEQLNEKRNHIDLELSSLDSEMRKAKETLSSIRENAAQEKRRIDDHRQTVLAALDNEVQAARSRAERERQSLNDELKEKGLELEKKLSHIAELENNIKIEAKRIEERELTQRQREIEFENRVKEINESLRDREEILCSSEEEVKKVRELQRRLEEFEVNLQTREAELDTKKLELDRKRKELEKLTEKHGSEIKKLEKKMESLQQYEKKLEEKEELHKSTVSEFEKQMELQMEANHQDQERLLEEARRIEAVADAALIHAKEAEAEEKATRSRLEELRELIEQAESQRSTVMEDVALVKRQLLEAQSELQDTIKSNENYEQGLQMREDELKTLEISLRAKGKIIDEDISKIESEKMRLKSELGALEASTLRIEEADARLSSMEREILHARTNMSHEANQLCQAYSELERERIRIEEVEIKMSQHIHEREALLADFENDLKQQQIAVDEERRQLNQQQQEHYVAFKELESKSLIYEEKEKEKENLFKYREEELKKLEAKLSLERNQLDDIIAKLSAEKTKLSEAQYLAEKEREDATRAQMEARRMKNDAENALSEVENERKRLEKREERISQLESEAENAKSKAAKEEYEISSTLQCAKQRELQANALMEDAKEKLQQATEYHRKSEKSRHAANEERHAAERLLSEIALRESDLQNAAIQLEAFERQLNEEKNRLEKRVQEVEKKMSCAQELESELREREVSIASIEQDWQEKVCCVESRENAASKEIKIAKEKLQAIEIKSAQLEEREAALIEAKSEYTARLSRLESLEKDIVTRSQSLAEREKNADDMLSQAKRDREKATDMVEESKIKVKAAEERAEHLSKISDDMEDRLAEATQIEARMKALAASEKELAVRQESFAEDRARLEQAMKELETLQIKINQDEESLHLYHSSLAEREKSCKELECYLEDRLHSLQAAEERIEGKEAELDQMKADHAIESEQLKAEIESVRSLKAELQNAQKQAEKSHLESENILSRQQLIQEMEETIKHKIQEVEEIAELLREKEASLSVASKKLDTMESKLVEHEMELKDKCDNYTKQEESLHLQLHELELQRQEMSSEKVGNQKVLEETEKMLSDIEIREKKLEEREKHIKELEHQLNSHQLDMDQKMRDLEKKRKIADRLISEASAKLECVEKTRLSLEMKEKEIQKMIAESLKEQEISKSEAKKASEALQAAQKREQFVDMRMSELKNAEDDLKQHISKLQAAEHRIQGLTDKLSKMSTECPKEVSKLISQHDERTFLSASYLSPPIPEYSSIRESVEKGARRIKRLDGIVTSMMSSSNETSSSKNSDPSDVISVRNLVERLQNGLISIEHSMKKLKPKDNVGMVKIHEEIMDWESALAECLEAVVTMQRSAIAIREDTS